MSIYWLCAVTVFWASVALVAYVYAAYPVLIWCLSRRIEPACPAPSSSDQEYPLVTVLIAAYNEEAVIEERVRNALAMDYPHDRFEIVIGLDGCSDQTAEIVRPFTDRRVRLLEYAQRRGKAAVLNAAMEEVEGQIVILSDANTEIDPQAARRLVRWFAVPGVGAAVGRLILTDPRSGATSTVCTGGTRRF